LPPTFHKFLQIFGEFSQAHASTKDSDINNVGSNVGTTTEQNNGTTIHYQFSTTLLVNVRDLILELR
jgi:hypothetical protein